MKPAQIFALRMLITSHVLNGKGFISSAFSHIYPFVELPVDFIASQYDYGYDYGIYYPDQPWGDWSPDSDGEDADDVSVDME
jgi:hypothetical protein